MTAKNDAIRKVAFESSSRCIEFREFENVLPPSTMSIEESLIRAIADGVIHGRVNGAEQLVIVDGVSEVPRTEEYTEQARRELVQMEQLIINKLHDYSLPQKRSHESDAW